MGLYRVRLSAFWAIIVSLRGLCDLAVKFGCSPIQLRVFAALREVSSRPFVCIRGLFWFRRAWQRSDGDLERRSSEGTRRCPTALAKSLLGTNSASARPILQIFPRSITPNPRLLGLRFAPAQ